MKTMQELSTMMAECEQAAAEYAARRAERLAEVKEYLEGTLRDGVNLDAIAADCLDQAEVSGWQGNDGYAEVRGVYTANGTPNAFSF